MLHAVYFIGSSQAQVTGWGNGDILLEDAAAPVP